mmetsp:Transcript_39941/g.59265  ORF Transcript_39941/g.59265 Transcript_39941/m.59265 type:complete len:93 (+) Transcript_39941:47-325(+)
MRLLIEQLELVGDVRSVRKCSHKIGSAGMHACFEQTWWQWTTDPAGGSSEEDEIVRKHDQFLVCGPARAEYSVRMRLRPRFEKRNMHGVKTE